MYSRGEKVDSVKHCVDLCSTAKCLIAPPPPPPNPPRAGEWTTWSCGWTVTRRERTSALR